MGVWPDAPDMARKSTTTGTVCAEGIRRVPCEYPDSVNTPPAKAGGLGLRLKAGLIGHSAD
jgi:hypothetical protein